MKQIGSYEAKTHLPRLLSEVRKGKRICITKKGTPVALLVPLESSKKSPEDAIAELRLFRKGVLLGDLSLRELISEGRRF